MRRKAATEFDSSVWRAWTSRLTSRTPQAAYGADLEGRRMMAEKRAAAAEVLAKEANTIRLKALLDAAREEAANRDIRSAEERFAAARGAWESVRRGLEAEPDPYAEPDETMPADAAPLPDDTPSPSSVGEIPIRKALLFGGLPLLLLVGGIGIAAYLHAMAEPSAPAGKAFVNVPITPAVRGPIEARDTPAAASVGATGHADAVAASPAEPGASARPISKAALIAPAANATRHAHAAMARARVHKRRIVPPPPPPARPDPDSVATGAAAPVVQPPAIPSIE